jgi:hypothetical protein
MHITETTFNKILYLIIIPLLFFIGSKTNQNIIIVIVYMILLYHIYSNYKYSTWPFNSCDNPDSISNDRKNPYWTEFLCIVGSIIFINIGVKNKDESFLYRILIIVGFIFGIAHLRQIFIRDNNYYRWMYEI